jgi:hypothetical protein
MLREHGADQAAKTLETLAGELETALHVADSQALTIGEAARLSGYSPDHLSRLVRDGKVANVGRKHAPRVRRADLPQRPTQRTDVASPTRKQYDPVADARSLSAGRLHPGDAHGT